MPAITLTEHQAKAKDRLVDFLLTKPEGKTQCIILQGVAGAGKTTIIKSVLEEYKNTLEIQKIAGLETNPISLNLTATTHKAVGVLKSHFNDFTKVTTLHSFLGLRPDGKVRSGYDNSPINPKVHIILIVDECSYIDYTLIDALENFVTTNPNTSIIFMGDNCQLTPVGLNHIPIYHQGFEVVELTEVVRQQNSPNIAQACQMIRDNIINDTPFSALPFDDTQLVHLDKKAFDKKMIELAKSGADYKVIRYSNAKVQQTNNKLHKVMHKRTRLEKGDAVMLNNHYLDPYYQIHRIPKSVILYISSIDPDNANNAAAIIKLYDDAGNQYRVRAVPDPSQIKDPILKDRYQLALAEGKLADLRRLHALTVHKSQGSTYDVVFINLNDFKNSYQRDKKETARLLYVALSRAKHTVYLTGDIT